MRLSEKLAQAINIQINKELYSEYFYLSMAAYFEAENLPGFANFFIVQTQEERFHVMKFFHYMHERGARVKLLPIAGPQTEFQSPLEIFQMAYKHEVYVSDSINELMDIAKADNDHASQVFLQWYIGEQVEEEASMDDIVNRLSRTGDNNYGLLMLDKELALRVFTPPVTQTN
ncbi:MAG: ferritin [Candidatus Cloacimonetes bacterium]|nr:ferritin [Candidatus Cloacimonadota bacterium]